LFEALEWNQMLGNVFVFIFGALWGSFANVVALRYGTEKGVVWKRSHCLHCGKTIAWYDNIPVLSWFLLRGHCRHCHQKFSFRYAFVEFLMGLLFLLAYQHYGFSISTLEFFIFIFALVAASVIDVDHYLLPDVFTLSGILIGLCGSLINPDRTFLDALAGVLLGGGFLWSIAYLYTLLRKEEGMGGGDIKLIAWIGSVLGWKSIPFVILVASVLGTAGGLLVMSRQKKGLKSVIPFGPYLAAAAVLYLLWGEDIGLWYLNLFVPGLLSDTP
jgi:leader peptidase (prepilin peptidase)/N-methyltransferase